MQKQSMADERIQAVIALVADVLDVEKDELGPDSSMENLPLWDSVEHMNICLAFEQRFGMRLDMDAIATATSIRSLAALVR
jgi:acyl carrier protein